MAHSAHTNPEQMVEHHDPADVLAEKVCRLAAMIRDSQHFVVFTGAGISTSAGIPDFRGPNGKWTRQARGQKPMTGVETVKAFPTPTHMALVALHNAGKLKYVISQNCDGLHRRSGFPAAAISELHGNGNVETCEDCGLQYFRDFRCDRMKGKACDHFTGRFCRCDGRLLNSTIDFGQGLPQKPLHKAREHSQMADLHLALGSSLTVSPANNMPELTASSKGKLVICNLQKTPLTEMAAFQIYAKTDVVINMLMEQLSIPIPSFRLLRRVILGVTEKEVYAKSVDLHDPQVQVGQICAVDWDGKGGPASDLEEPMIVAARNGMHHRARAGMNLRALRPRLHFMGHYQEPPLQISADLSVSDKPLDFMLSFDPCELTWDCRLLAGDELAASVDEESARIPDYGESHREYCVNKVMEARNCDRHCAEQIIKQRVKESREEAQRRLRATVKPSDRAAGRSD